MKFKVYNGPGHPNCSEPGCSEKIIVQCSDRHCWTHAMLALGEYEIQDMLRMIKDQIGKGK